MKYFTNTAMCELESNCIAQDAEMLLQGARKVDLDEFPSLKYMYRAGIGSENMPLAQIQERGIQVWYPPMSVREEISKAVAELTWSFVMHSNTFARSDLDTWKRDKRPSMSDVRTLVIGSGNIGTLVGRGLGSQVQYYDIRSSMPPELKDKLGWADIVTLHIPSTCINLGVVVAYNKGFIDEEKLSWMKPGATLINTSRGDVVDEIAVCDWLSKDMENKYYADVHGEEPYDGMFNGYQGTQFFGTPHMASYNTRVVRGNTDFAQGLMDTLDGKTDESPVPEG